MILCRDSGGEFIVQRGVRSVSPVSRPLMTLINSGQEAM